MFSTLQLRVTFVKEDSNVDGSGVYDRKEQRRMLAASLFVSLSLLLLSPS